MHISPNTDNSYSYSRFLHSHLRAGLHSSTSLMRYIISNLRKGIEPMCRSTVQVSVRSATLAPHKFQFSMILRNEFLSFSHPLYLTSMQLLLFLPRLSLSFMLWLVPFSALTLFSSLILSLPSHYYGQASLLLSLNPSLSVSTSLLPHFSFSSTLQPLFLLPCIPPSLLHFFPLPLSFSLIFNSTS